MASPLRLPLPLLLKLLRQFSWRELTHHPWRNAAAVAAVMLGVALAFATHLINASALSEFSTAVRSVNGQPDLELRAAQGTFDEAFFEQLANNPHIAVASPVLELASYALAYPSSPDGKRIALRVIGLDALVVAQMAPALMPQPTQDADRFSLFSPGSVFLNAAARQALTDTFKIQSGLQLLNVKVVGSVAAGGAALAVMDIGAAQEMFGKSGQLSRIDLRLKPGTDRATFIQTLQLPAGIVAGKDKAYVKAPRSATYTPTPHFAGVIDSLFSPIATNRPAWRALLKLMKPSFLNPSRERKKPCHAHHANVAARQPNPAYLMNRLLY